PANNFGGQEPGTEEEIVEFCTTNYGVTFPMFSKISVAGDDRHPLYDALIEAAPERTEAEGGSRLRARFEERGRMVDPGQVLWNFEKFLIDREGNVVDRFITDLKPEDPIVIGAIEEALAK